MGSKSLRKRAEDRESCEGQANHHIEDYWRKCDVLITASSKVLELKPEDKVGIKYLSDYNLNTESNYEITKFSDLFNIEFLTNNE
jgi:hypothetical protein